MLAKSKTIDTSKQIDWSDKGYLGEFEWLVDHPPVHSVMIRIAPEVARDLLNRTNKDNRNVRATHAAIMAKSMRSGDYEVTGDSIKFDVEGQLLDGQHRLLACADSGVALVTHVVFGLPKKIFDTLDRGARRSASDVLAKAGYHNTHLLAATIQLLKRIELAKSVAGGWKWQEALTPRDILHLAKTEFSDLSRFVPDALKANLAYKYPPSVVLAVLYMIQRHDPKLAATFIAEWLSGPRTGRNKGFDVLSTRLTTMRAQSTAPVSRQARLALLIITFNHWNAGIVPAPRALSWKSKAHLPQIELDGESFAANRRAAEQIGTSLAQVQERVLEAIRPRASKNANKRAHMAWADLAKESHVPPSQVRYVVRSLIDDGHLARGTVVGREHVTAYLSESAFHPVEGASAE